MKIIDDLTVVVYTSDKLNASLEIIENWIERIK